MQKWNTELAAEVKAIEKDKAREGKDEEDHELPMVRLGKQKAVALKIGEEEVDELAEDKMDSKQAKMSSDELLDVEGPGNV